LEINSSNECKDDDLKILQFSDRNANTKGLEMWKRL
jgi:hypothetical protein